MLCVSDFLQKKQVTKRQLQSIAGKLSHAAKVVHGARLFLRHLFNAIGKLQHHKTRIQGAVKADRLHGVLQLGSSLCAGTTIYTPFSLTHLPTQMGHFAMAIFTMLCGRLIIRKQQTSGLYRFQTVVPAKMKLSYRLCIICSGHVQNMMCV